MEDTAVIFGALCVLAGFKYSVLLSGYRKRPKKAELVGRVSAIWYYPIKSCRGISLKEATCTQQGLKPKDSQVLDRHLCVCDPEAKSFLTQRQEPGLSLITPTLTSGGDLRLEAPDQPPLTVALPKEGAVIPCRVWFDKLDCLDCGPEAEKWLTNYLGQRRGLVFAADHLPKRSEDTLTCHLGPLYTAPHERVAFADFSSYLLATEASLADLNGKLATPVPITNFRPNLVLSNKSAFDEDNWEEIFINNVRFRRVKHCDRCAMTTIDSSVGEKRKDEEPLKTLRSYRLMPEVSKTSPIFGVNIFADLEGDIKVGDDVYVIYEET